MNQIWERIKTEPAIISGLAALLSIAVASAVEVIELNGGGEVVAIIVAILGAAGVTRENVTPTSKL